MRRCQRCNTPTSIPPSGGHIGYCSQECESADLQAKQLHDANVQHKITMARYETNVQLNLTEEEAERLVANYYETYPEAAANAAKITQRSIEEGTFFKKGTEQ